MNDLVIAVFGVQSSTSPQAVHNDVARVGFACGVVRFEHYHRHGRSVTRRTVYENVYWNPAAMVADLLHPRVHACVAFNGHGFDVPLLAHAVVPPSPGPYLSTSDAAEVVACARAMRAVQLDGAPLVRFGPPVRESGGSRWSQLGARVLAWLGWAGVPGGYAVERAVGRWLVLRGHHDPVYPPGAAGLRWRLPEAMATALRAKTLDPLYELGLLAGGTPRLVRLRSLVAGLSQPPPLPSVDRRELPAWWRAGREWEVIDVCRAEVSALAEVLHVALDAQALMASELHDEAGTADLSAVISPAWGKGGVHRYRFSTSTWWSTLAGYADREDSGHDAS